MKITKNYLKQIIQEELNSLDEGEYSNVPQNLQGMPGWFGDLRPKLQNYLVNATEAKRRQVEDPNANLSVEESMDIVMRTIQLLAKSEARETK